MAKTYEQVVKLLEPLDDDYRDRHEAHLKLRQFWHGRYWEKIDADRGGVSSIFRDLTARTSDVGPDIKLTYNILKDVCVKFQTFLSPLPMIRMYVDPPASQTRKGQATLKERYLYGTWAANNMNKVMADKGWYLPLMGDCFLGIWPDFKTNLPRVVLRGPEHAYPIPSFDMSGEDAIIFKYRARESAVRRAFPEYDPQASRTRGRFQRGGSSDPEVEVIEYSDANEFTRFVGTQRVDAIEHDFGFNLFEHVKFINVPGEVWGHGAVEQAVNLVEMGNAYLSLMMQSAIENVFPPLVLEDPQKMPEQIDRGAGAVLPVNAGGKAYYLTAPGGNLLANAEWAQEIERMIKLDSSMPDASMGTYKASIVTGKAINELQGAGTGSLVEMVQGVGIGAALTSWNAKAIEIGRRMFKDDRIYLYGNEAAGVADINPRHFAFSIKGSQLVGSTRNEVVFMPHLDMHSKIVMGLQLAQAGLVSRQWQREQVGIPDSEAMDEEIVGEAIQDAVLGFLLQSLTDPEMAAQVEGQAFDKIGLANGDTGVNSPPILGITGPTNTPGVPSGAAPPAPGAALPMSPDGEATPPPGQGAAVSLDEALSQLSQGQYAGRVFLIGEIVAQGATDDAVEVAVTAPEDRDVIAQIVQFEVSFRVVDAEPNEQFVEVTAGGVSGGAEPAPDELVEV